MTEGATNRRGRIFLAAQGIYYLATGLWPLASIGTFQKVTGRKTDLWLVKTVGGLVAVIGGTLLLSSRRRRVTPDIGLLAGGSAIVFAAVETFYSLTGRISKIYLGDVPIQVLFAVSRAIRFR